MNNVIGTICEGREVEGDQWRALPNSGRDDDGLAALERLSLEDLAALAAREIGEGMQLQAEAVGLSRRSTAAFYRAGRSLWCARKKLKGESKRAWTKWQKANGIPTTSAWQAIRLYEEADSEEAVAGLTRTQALKKYGITKPRKDRPQPAPAASDGFTTQANVATEVVAPAQAGGKVAFDIASAPSPDLRLAPERNAGHGGTTSLSDGAEDVIDRGMRPRPDPDMPPPADTLLCIVRRLEILERDLRGGELGEEAHALLDQAIATLLRMRGDSDPVTGAA
jgi:hypothetical protein